MLEEQSLQWLDLEVGGFAERPIGKGGKQKDGVW